MFYKIDFGLAKAVGQSVKRLVCTWPFRAPEAFDSDEVDITDKGTDVFSEQWIGFLLFGGKITYLKTKYHSTTEGKEIAFNKELSGLFTGISEDDVLTEDKTAIENLLRNMQTQLLDKRIPLLEALEKSEEIRMQRRWRAATNKSQSVISAFSFAVLMRNRLVTLAHTHLTFITSEVRNQLPIIMVT